MAYQQGVVSVPGTGNATSIVTPGPVGMMVQNLSPIAVYVGDRRDATGYDGRAGVYPGPASRRRERFALPGGGRAGHCLRRFRGSDDLRQHVRNL